MKNAKSLYVSVDRLTLVLYGEDVPGCIYSNYSSGRKVCGIVCATGGEAEYLFSDGRVRVMKAGEVALFSHKSAYIVRNNTETFSHYTINFELNELAQKVIHANPDSSIYKNLLERVAVNYEMTKQKIIELKDQPDWKDGKVDVKEMINRIQPILQEGMKRNGWINILTYLNCYGDVSQVATEFNSHNLHVLQLGKLNSLIRALLGMVQISIFIPRLLIDEFNTDYYEFKNSETWIDKFCPAICPRDYAGKVFDLIQMGYQIQGKELISYKPLVVYF